jgi:hypothetical protein
MRTLYEKKTARVEMIQHQAPADLQKLLGDEKSRTASMVYRGHTLPD